MNNKVAEIGIDIERAARLLQLSDVVAIPTETVYGLAGNALDEMAATKIFKVKNRPAFDPLIIHTDTIDKVKIFVEDLPDQAKRLADAFWPGPLTLLLTKKDIIPDLVTSGSPLVAVRIPNHPLTLKLLSLLDFPLAAPSANPFGYISPTTAEHVAQQLGNDIRYILDGGPCEVGIESSIIGFEGNLPVVYRMGGLKIEEIEKVVGPIKLMPHSASNPQAPGMLKSHYAPTKPFYVGNLKELADKHGTTDTAILTFSSLFPEVDPALQYVLSPNGNLDEAARNLFSAMRHLDNLAVKQILATFLPDEGLGRAINDRLRRAAAK
jgi:L-threonylcarbamoyladenylate synthase